MQHHSQKKPEKALHRVYRHNSSWCNIVGCVFNHGHLFWKIKGHQNVRICPLAHYQHFYKVSLKPFQWFWWGEVRGGGGNKPYRGAAAEWDVASLFLSSRCRYGDEAHEGQWGGVKPRYRICLMALLPPYFCLFFLKFLHLNTCPTPPPLTHTHTKHPGDVNKALEARPLYSKATLGFPLSALWRCDFNSRAFVRVRACACASPSPRFFLPCYN